MDTPDYSQDVERYISVSLAARRLSVTRQTVRIWARAGYLRSIKYAIHDEGGRVGVIVDADSVSEVLARQNQYAPHEPESQSYGE